MTYGLQVMNSGGSLVFSTGSHLGMVYGGTVQVPYNPGSQYTDNVYSFPDWAGRTGFVVVFGITWMVLGTSWAYPSGIPTLTIRRAATYAYYSEIPELASIINAQVFFK